jgi:hypothetical protein
MSTEDQLSYTPLINTGFDKVLSPAVSNLQALAEAVDEHDHLALVAIPPVAEIAGKVLAFDTVGLVFYVWNGSAWISISGGAPGANFFHLLEDGVFHHLLEDGVSKHILG